MKFYHSLIAVFALLLAFTTSEAATLRPQVVLLSIQPLTQADLGKKEVYVSISEVWSSGKAKTICIPKPPVHWKLKTLKKQLNARLWRGRIKEGRSVKLNITLFEQNNPPWDPTHLVGVAKLALKNNAGVLESHWSVDKGSSEALPSGAQRFSFNDTGAYQMDLTIKK